MRRFVAPSVQPLFVPWGVRMVTKNRYLQASAAGVPCSGVRHRLRRRLFAQGAAAQHGAESGGCAVSSGTRCPTRLLRPSSAEGRTQIRAGSGLYAEDPGDIFQKPGPRRFSQICPPRVWGYGKTGQAPSFPGRTFEVQRGTPHPPSATSTALTNLAGAPLPNRMPSGHHPGLGEPGRSWRHHPGSGGGSPARRRLRLFSATACPTPGEHPVPKLRRRGPAATPRSAAGQAVRQTLQV